MDNPNISLGQIFSDIPYTTASQNISIVENIGKAWLFEDENLTMYQRHHDSVFDE